MKIIGTVGRAWADVMYGSASDSITELLQFSQMALCKPNEMILFNQGRISWHEGMRNQLVEEMEGDWLLQLDTDHIFSSDLLVRLLAIQKAQNAPVVSAIYQYKHHPHSPVAGYWTGEKTLTPLKEWDRSKLTLEVGAVGAGALLVRKEVFKRIKEELKQPPFATFEGLSEDYSFCRRCRDLGIPITLATTVEAHHLIRSALHIGDYIPNEVLRPAKVQGGQVILEPESQSAIT